MIITVMVIKRVLGGHVASLFTLCNSIVMVVEHRGDRLLNVCQWDCFIAEQNWVTIDNNESTALLVHRYRHAPGTDFQGRCVLL